MKVLNDLVEGINDAKKSANPWILTDEISPGAYKHLNLIELPAIMQKTGRHVGAKLMNLWFSKTAYTMPDNVKAGRAYVQVPQGVIELNAVTMKWLLQYTRAHSAYSSLKDVIDGRNNEG